VLYAELNKNLFNDRLKVAVRLVALNLQGNLFQIWGAATAKTGESSIFLARGEVPTW